jgi:hypothetical protein
MRDRLDFLKLRIISSSVKPPLAVSGRLSACRASGESAQANGGERCASALARNGAGEVGVQASMKTLCVTSTRRVWPSRNRYVPLVRLPSQASPYIREWARVSGLKCRREIEIEPGERQNMRSRKSTRAVSVYLERKASRDAAVKERR